MADKILSFLIDSSDSAFIKYWIARNTDLPFEDLAHLAKNFEDIYSSDPVLARSSFELETTLRAYFRELIDLHKKGSVSVRLDRQNIATGYAFFIGSERNLLNYGAYQYHASPVRLAERYKRAAERYQTDSDMYAALDHIRDELSTGIYDGAEGERELYLYNYLIYALEEPDIRMSAIARFILERLGRITSDEDADENRTEHIYFFEKVLDALPDLEDLRDGAPQRTAGHTPEVKMLLLAFNQEPALFEAFIGFFNALSDKGYFETFRDFTDMPQVSELLEEVTDRVLFSRLRELDRNFTLATLKVMRKSVVQDSRSELDDDIKNRLNAAAGLIIRSIRKELSPGSGGCGPRGAAGWGPLNYHAPWMGMAPAMQAGAGILTAARPMPFLGMPFAMLRIPF